VIDLQESVGVLETQAAVFEGDVEACIAKARELGLSDPNGVLPQSTVSASVGSGQIRVALRRKGIGASEEEINTVIETAINSLPDDGTRADAIILWRYAYSFERQHPFIIAVASALNKDAAWLDDLFCQAATV
jgi:hypothetical protein